MEVGVPRRAELPKPLDVEVVQSVILDLALRLPSHGRGIAEYHVTLLSSVIVSAPRPPNETGSTNEA